MSEDAGVDAGDTVDAGPPADEDAGPGPGACGNNELNAGEECDDGNRENDDGCSADCAIECGDGVVGANETCDTGIAAGDPGACPASCDDGMSCTSDVLSGSECTASCVNAPITAAMNGDGCCPAGETSLTDDDCPTNCGNMMLEPGEMCEDGTAMPCPTNCDDGNTCTTDTLTGMASTCDAVCTNTDITMCSMTSDGCCPMGCDFTTDSDCSASCGNGIFEPPTELCEDGTANPCPTSCDDGMACTDDVLTGSPSMCNVQCSNPPITMCIMASDGCCPAACNATNDGDCMPVCGNGVMEMGEGCDDGNTMPGDGCDAMCMVEAIPPTAFRINELELRDPSAQAVVFPGFCINATGQLNTALRESLTMDMEPSGMPDGILDLSFLVVFRPLAQSAMGGMVDLINADCTAPVAGTTCTRMLVDPPLATAMYTNQTTGTCLDAMPGGATVARGTVVNATAPCFVTAPQSLMLTLGGVPLNLRDAQLAATYVGTPATSLRNGLIRGFITETDADLTTLPASLPLVGGMPLSSVLRGSSTNTCSPSDLDMHPVHGRGWWFFANFAPTTGPGASVVPLTEL